MGHSARSSQCTGYGCARVRTEGHRFVCSNTEFHPATVTFAVPIPTAARARPSSSSESTSGASSRGRAHAFSVQPTADDPYGLTINPTAPQKELTNCGVSIVAGGLLFAITLFVKFGTDYIAPFHAGYDIYLTTVLAAGIVVAGLLLCSARTALLGVGAVLAPVAVLDAYFLGDVAALATPGRGYGWGFWILGLAAAFTNVAVLQAVREVDFLGRMKKPVERPPAGWIAASVIFGFLVAIGVGLPHRVETVFTFRGRTAFTPSDPLLCVADWIRRPGYPCLQRHFMLLSPCYCHSSPGLHEIVG